MNQEILSYNASQSSTDREICHALMEEISRNLPESKSKIWHGSPVWFIDDNPIVGYSKRKNCVQLLFWSGQSFDEEELKPVEKSKAAKACYTGTDAIDLILLSLWLKESMEEESCLNDYNG